MTFGTTLGFLVSRLQSFSGTEEKRQRTLILASGLFDPNYYIKECPDAAGTGIDPVVHYIRHGAQNLCSPSAAFDAARYNAENADVRQAQMNPLVHYLIHGQSEGRKIRPATAPAPWPKAPPPGAWPELASQCHGCQAPVDCAVDVVVPVYRGLDETANCLHSIVQSRIASGFPFEIVVIDDASPEPELSALLVRLADLKLITLLRNERNLGFVSSVNRGMELHQDRDVILLNSDTEVYGDWVERLRRSTYSAPNIGTATPFSNDATICGYPYFPDRFQGALEISFEELDRLASRANAGQVVDLPTANGFCMYIRRVCLKEAGLFDAKAFGLGYGEENDFCLRIESRGWRNVLAGDVFVRHRGGVSFLDTTHARIRRALELVNSRYPRYLKDVAAFIKADPPRQLRRNIDIARLRRAGGARSVLFVLHSLVGGTPRHVEELSQLLAKEGVGAYLLRPIGKDDRFVEFSHAEVSYLSTSGEIDITHDCRKVIDLVRELGVAHIHVHHFQGFPSNIATIVEGIARETGLDYDFTAHDYLSICPRITMVDGSGVYCDNRDVTICETCVESDGSPFGNVGVWPWRENYRRFLAGARKVFVPDEDVKLRLNAFLPSQPITVRPHPEPTPDVYAEPIPRAAGAELRVAIIGAIGPHKGSNVLLQCALDAAQRRLPIKFVLIGWSDRTELQDLPVTEVTGPYEEKDLTTLLLRKRCHLSFFPSVWPETYSYTLSQAVVGGLFPVAFDIGAIARRIRELDWGLVLPFDQMKWPGKVNDALLACKIPPRPASAVVPGYRRYRGIISDYYELEPARFGLDVRSEVAEGQVHRETRQLLRHEEKVAR